MKTKIRSKQQSETMLVTMLARLTILGASEMSKERRREIAQWLRMQARDLLSDGDQYSDRFTARFIVN